MKNPPKPTRLNVSKTSAEEVPSDGRHNRSIVMRKRIVDAFTGLVTEGVISPTAEQVAARAGIGLRTVFRHFDDMETLFREVGTYVNAVIAEILKTPLQSTDWQGKLMESVGVRAKLFEKMMHFNIAWHIHRHTSPYLEAYVYELHELDSFMLKMFLPKELAQDTVRFQALMQVLSCEAWVRMRRDQKLSRAAAQKVMEFSVKSLTS